MPAVMVLAQILSCGTYRYVFAAPCVQWTGVSMIFPCASNVSKLGHKNSGTAGTPNSLPGQILAPSPSAPRTLGDSRSTGFISWQKRNATSPWESTQFDRTTHQRRPQSVPQEDPVHIHADLVRQRHQGGFHVEQFFEEGGRRGVFDANSDPQRASQPSSPKTARRPPTKDAI